MRDLPHEINRNDRPAVQAWLLESFQDWLAENREELLAKEWVRRDWAKMVIAPDDSGKMRHTCQVKPERKSEVDAWMADQLD